jgi:hypothetical protein
MQLQIKFSDCIRRKQGILAALIDKISIAFGLDLSVDDDESDVYALGSQLTSHALGECAQTELGNR